MPGQLQGVHRQHVHAFFLHVLQDPLGYSFSPVTTGMGSIRWVLVMTVPPTFR